MCRPPNNLPSKRFPIPFHWSTITHIFRTRPQKRMLWRSSYSLPRTSCSAQEKPHNRPNFSDKAYIFSDKAHNFSGNTYKIPHLPIAPKNPLTILNYSTKNHYLCPKPNATNKGISIVEAIKTIYTSQSYQRLKMENTKTWHLGPAALYQELEEELSSQ